MPVVVQLNRSGIRDLLRSAEVERDLRDRAESVSRAAGPGHVVDSDIGPTRARAAVITETFEAMRAEATGHALTSALDAAR